MKLKIDRKIFAQALAEVAQFIPQKPVIEIQKNAKFTTKGKYMKLEAGGSESSIIKYVEMVECDTDGSFLANATDLSRFVAKTKGDIIEVEFEDTTVFVRHSKGVAEFQSEDAKGFPKFKMPDNDVTEVVVNPMVLSDFISKGRAFVSDNDSTPQLKAVYAYLKDGRFGFCATNQSKMCSASVPSAMPEGMDEAHWLIMPAIFSSLNNVCRAHGSSDVLVKITDTHVSYRVENTIIQSVLVLQKYPPFERVLGIPWTNECSVDKADLMDSLTRIQMFCNDSGCVKLQISRMDMTLSVDNFMEVKKSSEKIVHNGCDTELSIGENVNYLIQCLSVMKDGEVLIRMSGFNRPLIFTQRENPDLVALAMPLKLIGE